MATRYQVAINVWIKEFTECATLTFVLDLLCGAGQCVVQVNEVYVAKL